MTTFFKIAFLVGIIVFLVLGVLGITLLAGKVLGFNDDLEDGE